MPRQPRLDAPGTLHHVIGRGIEGGFGLISQSDWEKRGSGGVGVAIWRAAREDIAGASFVLPNSGGEDGLSGSGSGSFSWGDHVGSGSCGPFGKSA